MARWQKSGGFGFAPTLPASVEDTYHALRILETIRPVSEREVRELKGNSGLKSFLRHVEDKETWSLQTGYQYLVLCGLCGVSPGQSWLESWFPKRVADFVSLRDGYYLMRMQREFPYLTIADCGRPLAGGFPKCWRTAEDLWMCLYLHEGSPVALHSTKEAITEWLQSCQAPDGGFGFVPESTSFIENSHWCLRSLSLLNSQPTRPDLARGFVLRCRSARGGFARNHGAAPLLYATWHGVASLALLQVPVQSPC